MISGIIKFEVSVISQRSRMISLTRPSLFRKSQKPNLTIVFEFTGLRLSAIVGE